jgi:hypothetical protein
MIEKLTYRAANALRSLAEKLWPEAEAPDFMRDFYVLDTHRLNRVSQTHMGLAPAELAYWAARVSGSRYVVVVAGVDQRVTLALVDPSRNGVNECWTRLDEIRPVGLLVEVTTAKVL